MKPIAVGWAKLPGTAIMIAQRCAILPTRLHREAAPRGQRAGTPCQTFAAAARARCPPYEIARYDSNFAIRKDHPIHGRKDQAVHTARRLSQHAGAQARRGPLGARRARIRGHQGREHRLQALGARRQVRSRRARHRDLSPGQGLRQALHPAARPGGGAQPASHARLQSRARPPRARRPHRQARGRAGLQRDDGRMGARHSAGAVRGRHRQGTLGDVRGSAHRRI